MAEIDLTAAIEAGKAAAEHHIARATLEARAYDGAAWNGTDVVYVDLSAVETAVRAAAPLIERAAREFLIGQVERRDSVLCDCSPRDEDPPISPNTGAEMDHHCDCSAVTAAATLHGRYTATRHAAECIDHSDMDEFYQVTAGDPPGSMARTGANRSGIEPPAVTPPAAHAAAVKAITGEAIA